jgi:lipopolysaccharide export system protein LptC
MSDYSETGAPDGESDSRPRHHFQYDPASARGEDVYEAAARHSRFVRWLKYILPVLVLAAAGLFWARVSFIPDGFDTLVESAGIDIESNSVIMNRPQISGFEGTRRAYEVKALEAIQSLSDPKVITFKQIEATIGLDQAGTAMIVAGKGIYDGNINSLTISDGITIETTDGYSARFTDAAIDLDASSLATDNPLEISSRDGWLRANSARVLDGGKRVSFFGGVALSFLPPGELLAPSQKNEEAGQ